MYAASRNPPIGHSLGWLAAKVSSDLSVATEVLREAGCDAAEIAVTAERLPALLKDSLGADLRMLSLHLPSFLPSVTENDGNSELASVVRPHSLAPLLHGDSRIMHGVVHPDQLQPGTIAALKKLKIPVGVENMDGNTASGRTIREIMEVCAHHQVPMVLDLQHLFENALNPSGVVDPSEFMALAVEFTLAAQKHYGISHLHVSGEIRTLGVQTECHASLLHATNRAQVLHALDAVAQAGDGLLPPIILEGDYLPGVAYAAPVTGSLRDELLHIAIKNMRAERELIQQHLSSL